MIIRILIYAFFTFFITNAYAGPFGINMGQPLSELDVADKDFNGFRAFLRSVPKPHAEFEGYAVLVSDERGVCSIAAFSKNYDNDKYGITIRNTISSLADALDKKYGSHRLVDNLLSGALWKNPEDWVMAIFQNERNYTYYWENPQVSNGENLSEIQLSAEAFSQDTSRILLRYHSKDYDKCKSEIDATENDSL